MKINIEISKFIENCKAISTHSHFIGGLFFDEINLKNLLEISYVNWSWLPLPITYAEKKEYFDKVRNRSYFIWLEKALQKIYEISVPLNEDTYDIFNNAVLSYSKQRSSVEKLQNVCLYDGAINDSYWNYGYNHEMPHFFHPTYRINIFLNGYDKNFVDREGNSVKNFFEANTYDEYLDKLEKHLKSKVKEGCVAFKCATAYERGLDFDSFNDEIARNAFKNGKDATVTEIKAFQDTIMNHICKIAASLDLPFQIHTGLGQVIKTEAKQLIALINKNLNTKFIMFHMSYPNAADVLELVHNYKNVYADLCWAPLISCEFAERTLSELLDVCNGNKICWGCDTWTYEESYGARLAINHVLSRVLSKKVEDGFFTVEFAKKVAENILINNAKILYKI